MAIDDETDVGSADQRRPRLSRRARTRSARRRTRGQARRARDRDSLKPASRRPESGSAGEAAGADHATERGSCPQPWSRRLVAELPRRRQLGVGSYSSTIPSGERSAESSRSYASGARRPATRSLIERVRRRPCPRRRGRGTPPCCAARSSARSRSGSRARAPRTRGRSGPARTSARGAARAPSRRRARAVPPSRRRRRRPRGRGRGTARPRARSGRSTSSRR